MDNSTAVFVLQVDKSGFSHYIWQESSRTTINLEQK